jgi:hypothetical protein
MKKSEFKEYLKTEILKMNEASAEDVKNQKDYNAELEKTKELMGDMMEGKMKKSEFKEYLKNEILREMNEQEEEIEDVDVNVDLGGDEEGFDGSFEMEEEGATIEDLSDELVDLAKKAKDAGAIELANQILNSAKFANKTKIKSAEKEAGLSAEG